MLRAATLLFFATAALAQAPRQPAYLSIETTAAGALHATLTVPVAQAPDGLPAAYASAIGCGNATLEKSTRMEVNCRLRRPTALRFHATFHLAELVPQLEQAGIDRLELVFITPHFRSLRIDPESAPQDSVSAGYYRAQYSLDELPERIVIDGRFDSSQARAVAIAAAGLILAPFLLLLIRPSDPLRLHVQMEGMFVLGWIAWMWILFRVEAGAMLAYFFGPWAIGTLAVLLAPPLAALSIGTRMAAAEYARLTPKGLGAAYYRRVKFWTGAAVSCIFATMLNIGLAAFADPAWSVGLGIGLSAVCVVRLRSTSRGGRYTLAEGELRTRMFALAAHAGVRLRAVSILTSATPRPPVALATRWRDVILNEALLQSLSRREVDAVVCHELSHVHSVKRSAMLGLYVLIVATVLGTQWVPHFIDVVPALLLAVYFWIKAVRRASERKADLDSVRWSGDPEAMISGLARVTRAQGTPLEWGAPVSWMLGHPPTLQRMKAIAHAGGLTEARVMALIEESTRDAADHYTGSRPAAIPEDASFSPALRQRLKVRLTWYQWLTPIVSGLFTVWLLQRIGLPWWAVLSMASLLSAAAMIVGYEWIAGSIREAVRKRAVARHGEGMFAGFSPSAAPRVFDGLYHYDAGLVRFIDEGLEFAGDRARFVLDQRLVRRVWLGNGPRHWTPRRVVYIECESSPDAGPVVFSLQSLEAWFWPSTMVAAKRLHRAVEDWRKTPRISAPPPLPCALPRAQGSPTPSISGRLALRTVSFYFGAAFLVASVGAWFAGPNQSFNPFGVFYPAVVCGALALFMIWPNLSWRRPATMGDLQSQLPADS